MENESGSGDGGVTAEEAKKWPVIQMNSDNIIGTVEEVRPGVYEIQFEHNYKMLMNAMDIKSFTLFISGVPKGF